MPLRDAKHPITTAPSKNKNDALYQQIIDTMGMNFQGPAHTEDAMTVRSEDIGITLIWR
jgi:hypothetical protein